VNKLCEELNLQIEEEDLVKKLDSIEKDESGKINFQEAIDSL
jgi:Ca2+-binding EF-hand superfamily protein